MAVPSGNSLLILIGLWLAMAWHELGHVSFGRLVGLRILRIQLGIGPRVGGFEWRGVKVRLHALPVLGLTLTAPPIGREFSRAAFWLAIAGGPLFSALAASAVYVMRGGAVEAFFPAHLGARADPWAVLGLVNAALCVGNLLPLKMNAATGRQPLDGRLLLSLPFASEHVCRELQRQLGSPKRSMRSGKTDVARGRQACAAGLQAHPSNTSLRAMDASLALLDGRYSEAREAFLALEATADSNKAIDPSARAVLWNNIAWADVRLADPGLLEEADGFSRRALEALPKNPSAMGTRGTVLAALGRDEEARRRLVSALALHTSPRSQALNWAVLAMVDARAGHVQDAQKHYDAARSSWPACDMLKQAEQTLAAAGAKPLSG